MAGYDIGKLFAGSLGTLGADYRGDVPPASGGGAHRLRDQGLRRYGRRRRGRARLAAASPLQASAAEIERPGPGAPVRVGILLEGTADGVSERAERMTVVLGARRTDLAGRAEVVGAAG